MKGNFNAWQETSGERGPGADGHLQSLSQTLSPNPHKGIWEGCLTG